MVLPSSPPPSPAEHSDMDTSSRSSSSGSPAPSIGNEEEDGSVPMTCSIELFGDELQTKNGMDLKWFLLLLLVSTTTAFLLGFLQQRQLRNLLPPPQRNLKEAITTEDMPTPDTVAQKSAETLIVDMLGLTPTQLVSEEFLSESLSRSLDDIGASLISYHCQYESEDSDDESSDDDNDEEDTEKSVSCLGTLLDASHISLHTFPSSKLVAFSFLFRSPNPKKWSRLLKALENNFRGDENQSSLDLRWSLNTRQSASFAQSDAHSDLGSFVLGGLDQVLKREILSHRTKYQQVGIWDSTSMDSTPTFADGLAAGLGKNDERWNTHEVTTPIRQVFQNGALKIDSYTQDICFEAFVHPGMFAHPHPARVGIVGGADGTVLREVLKHGTVDSVTLVEKDEELLSIFQEHMPYLSDCSKTQGRANDCFKDDTLTVVHEDEGVWFESFSEEPLDVLIVSSEDLAQSQNMVYAPLDEPAIMASMVNSLSEEGVLVIDYGSAVTPLDPKAEIGHNARREALLRELEHNEKIAALFVYEEAECGDLVPNAFLMACRSASCRKRYYADPEETDFQIYKRILPTTREASTRKALTNYDGNTQRKYQEVPKAWEILYCRREPTPFECAYRQMDLRAETFTMNMDNEEDGDLLLMERTVDEEWPDDYPTRIVANVDIPKGSFLLADQVAAPLIMTDQTFQNVNETRNHGPIIADFVEFLESQGRQESPHEGWGRRVVEVGVSVLMQSMVLPEQANVGRWLPAHPNGVRPTYSPVYERHRLSFDTILVATQDIPKGTDLRKWDGMWNAP